MGIFISFFLRKIVFWKPTYLILPSGVQYLLISCIYFCNCRVNVIHHISKKIHKGKQLKRKMFQEKCLFQRFYKLFLSYRPIADHLHETDLSCLLLMTEFIHYSLLFWYLDVQPKSIAYLVYWVTSIDKNYHCLNRGQCLISKENIFSVCNRLAVCRRIAIGQCPDTP